MAAGGSITFDYPLGTLVKDKLTSFTGIVTGVFYEERGISYFVENEENRRYIEAEQVEAVVV